MRLIKDERRIINTIFIGILLFFASIFIETVPVTFAAIALDKSGSCGVLSASTCNFSLTLATTNELIIVAQESNVGSNANTCNTPTSSPSYTFSSRNTVGPTKITSQGEYVTFCEYYAIATSSGSITITCNWSASQTWSTCQAFSVSGEDSSTPFDTNANAKCSHAWVASITSISCSVSTSNANDMIIGLAGCITTLLLNRCDNTDRIGTGSGYTTILIKGDGSNHCASSTASCSEIGTEYKIVSSTQSSLSVAFTTTSSSQLWYASFGDAIRQATSSGVTTTLSFTYTYAQSISLLKPSFILSETLLYSPSSIQSLSYTFQLISNLLYSQSISQLHTIFLNSLSYLYSQSLSSLNLNFNFNNLYTYSQFLTSPFTIVLIDILSYTQSINSLSLSLTNSLSYLYTQISSFICSPNGCHNLARQLTLPTLSYNDQIITVFFIIIILITLIVIIFFKRD